MKEEDIIVFGIPAIAALISFFHHSAGCASTPGEQYYSRISEAETRRPIMVEGIIPTERTKEITKVTVTSENARRLQESITIVDRPTDVLATAISF
jgi:hypothetical protein